MIPDVREVEGRRDGRAAVMEADSRDGRTALRWAATTGSNHGLEDAPNRGGSVTGAGWGSRDWRTS